MLGRNATIIRYHREARTMRAIATITLLALSSPLLAQEELSYNYIEGSWGHIDIDDSEGDFGGEGFGLSGSLEVADNWHIFASYGSYDLDFSIDQDVTEVGGGFHTPLAPGMDLVFDLAYINVDSSGPGFSFDEDGLGTSLGLRMKLVPRWEIEGEIAYQSLDNNDETSIGGSVWYELTRNFSLGFEADVGEDEYGYGIAGRVYFE
jgi:Outer membrane protein beta-barrel domain